MLHFYILVAGARISASVTVAKTVPFGNTYSLLFVSPALDWFGLFLGGAPVCTVNVLESKALPGKKLCSQAKVSDWHPSREH